MDVYDSGDWRQGSTTLQVEEVDKQGVLSMLKELGL
jgi:hypothetical protein